MKIISQNVLSPSSDKKCQREGERRKYQLHLKAKPLFSMLPYSSFVFRLGEACNHIAALLFALEDYVKSHNNTTSDNIACTSKPCEWNKPRKRKLSPKRIDEIRPVNTSMGKYQD